MKRKCHRATCVATLILFVSAASSTAFAKDPTLAEQKEIDTADRRLSNFDEQIAAAIGPSFSTQQVVELRQARLAYYKQIEPRLMEFLDERQSALRLRVAEKGLGAAEVKAEQARVDQLQRLLAFVNSMGMKFIIVEPGTFMMGSPPAEAGRQRREIPHKVTITRPFRMGVMHVTRGQFAAFVAKSGYKTDAELQGQCEVFDGKSFAIRLGGSWRNTGFFQTDEHPVVNVSWNDAMAFCKWLSAKEGKAYRLPTEAEWEYACRAGAKTAYFWGDDPNGGQGYINAADLSARDRFPDWKLEFMFPWRDGYVFTSPAGAFKPNPLGLYDMIGNAWQWCSDFYGPYPRGDAVDPTGPMTGDNESSRVNRGGSWSMSRDACRCAAYGHDPSNLANSIHFPGFRVCLSF